MEIKDTLCENCICLAICSSKLNKYLLYDCVLLRDNIRNTANSMGSDASSFITINFIGLKTLTIYRKADRVYVYTENLLWEIIMDIDNLNNVHLKQVPENMRRNMFL